MKKRFKGSASTDYNLAIKSVPFYNQFQAVVGKKIYQYFKGDKKGGLKLLEIGCGSGLTTSAVLKYNKNIQIVCLDNEPAMIRQIKKFLNQPIKKKQIQLILADATTYLKKLKTASFDAVYSGLTFHNFSQAEKASVLKNIYRVLKPGGIFINADKIVPNTIQGRIEMLKNQYNLYLKYFLPINRVDLIQYWVNHDLEDLAPDLILTEKSMVRLMQNSQFKNIKYLYKRPMYKVVSALK